MEKYTNISNIIKILNFFDDLRQIEKFYISSFVIQYYECMYECNDFDDFNDDEKKFVKLYEDIEEKIFFEYKSKCQEKILPFYNDESSDDNGMFHMYVNENVEHIILCNEIYKLMLILEAKLLILENHIDLFSDFHHPYDEKFIIDVYNIYYTAYKKYKTICEKSYEIVEFEDIIYKLIGDENNSYDYVNANLPKKQEDWSGIYFQLDKQHALESLAYRYDKKYKKANLIELKTKKLKLAKFSNCEFLYSNKISQEEKAKYIKYILNIDYDKKLLDNLECDGLFIEERKSEFEIIIPISKIKNSFIFENIIETHNTNEIFL